MALVPWSQGIVENGNLSVSIWKKTSAISKLNSHLVSFEAVFVSCDETETAARETKLTFKGQKRESNHTFNLDLFLNTSAQFMLCKAGLLQYTSEILLSFYMPIYNTSANIQMVLSNLFTRLVP